MSAAVFAAALFLAGWSAVPWGLLVVPLLLFLTLTESRMQKWIGAAAFVVALGLAIDERNAAVSEAADDAAWQGRAELAYDRLWSDLEGAAAEAVARLGSPPEGSASRIAALRALEEIVAARLPEGTLLLLDPDGEEVVWSGVGLLNDLDSETLTEEGNTFRESFGSSTALSLRLLGPGRERPWRVVAGISLSRYSVPVPKPRGLVRRPFWWFVRSAEVAGPTRLRIEREATPPLVLNRSVDPPPAEDESGVPVRRDLPLALAVGGLLLVWLRASSAERSGWSQLATLALLFSSTYVLASTISRSPPVAALLATAAVLAMLSASFGRPASRPFRFLASLFALAFTLAAAYGLQLAFGPVDLSAGWLAAAPSFLLRLALFLLAFSQCAAWVPRREGSEGGGGDAAVSIGLVLLLASAAFPDFQVAAAAALLVGGSVALSSRALPSAESGASRILVVALVAALASASASGIAHRWALGRQVETVQLPALGPPDTAEIEALRGEVEEFLPKIDRARGLLRRRGLNARDLAYFIWRESPLNRRGLLSALTISIAETGQVSTFSFGVPMARTGQADRDPVRWSDIDLPVWRHTFVEGDVAIGEGGETWARAKYWALPRPGFRLSSEPVADLEVALLRGPPELRRPAQGELGTALYALYDEGGRPLQKPWPETSPLDPQLEALGRSAIDTPGGRSRGFIRRDRDGIEAVYLPNLPVPTALEQAGVFASSVLLLPALVLLLSAAFRVRDWRPRELLRRTLRSYSRRILIVYTVLLLVPLVALNLFVLREASQRLEREQLASGESALESAQRMIGEFVLELEPGFGIEASLDDEFLVRLSRIIHHEVNLYWESRVYASSRPEIFAAGLLPSRIPGDIHARLSLLGYDRGIRITESAETRYLELYAPLEIPGVADQEKLFLSVPLLAQQEELAEQFASLRRRVMLATASLFLLLTVVGTGLARSFTKPLLEIIRGTQRIAAGERSLGLAPRELELAALTEAIDEMARRIALGREKLVREKQVVESMVENIRAGVVSLDREQRVLLRNQVASELLGVEVGAPLLSSLAARDELEPVWRFVTEAGEELEQRTVHLSETGGDEEEGSQEGKDWSLVWVPVPGSGEPAALLVVEDATEVLRSQRLEAWAEMARMIAHEIKNPLTPIRLSAEHMQQVHAESPARFDEVFEKCTTNILRQVEELRQIASDFSVYSRLPEIEPEDGDLASAVEELVAGYTAAPPEGIAIRLDLPSEPVPARFDERTLGRAVRNLIENALHVTSGGGEVSVRVARVGSRDGLAGVEVVVEDDGPGVAPEDLGRIFDPYFSTHSGGTGLGLPISRRIVEEHGGTMSAANRSSGGLAVRIRLPCLEGADCADGEETETGVAGATGQLGVPSSRRRSAALENRENRGNS